MLKTKNILIISILVTALSACGAQATPTPAPQPTTIIEVISTPPTQSIPLSEADVPRITIEEAKAAIESGAAVVVDVRSKTAYDAQHIAGAISIPFPEIQANPTGVKLDKEQWIITYCT
jgi:3-mercaptopyruvate sulfurtransferase SseA